MPDRAQQRRRTLAGDASVEGVGLFTAERCKLTIKPAGAGTGLVFVVRGERIPATIGRLWTGAVHPAFEGRPPRNTTIAADPTDPESPRAITTEHVLGAMVGLGITDALIEMTAEEVPIDDGSARAFVEAVRAVGTRELGGEIEAVVIDREIVVGDGATGVRLVPGDTSLYRYRLDYGAAQPLLRGEASIGLPSGEAFAERVAPARTFSLEAEAVAMREAGLFPHVSPRDLLVIGQDGPVDNELRFEGEPAAHKLLDLIGDLALVGRPIVGRIEAVRSGHAMNHEAARRLFASIF